MHSHDYLPLDVYCQIFAFLPRTELQKMLFMNSALCRLAEEFLSKHISLHSESWRKTCTFFVEGKGSRLLNRTKKLTVFLEDMPIVRSYPEEASNIQRLCKFIEIIGFQLSVLTLDGRSEHEYSLTWDTISWEFRETLVIHALPFIHSLKILESTSLPLQHIIRHCPHLRHIHLSAEYDVITSEMVEKQEDIKGLPVVSSMSFGEFGEVDFDRGISLFQYLREASSTPTSLHFETWSGVPDFPLKLPFLDSFDRLKDNLLSLSFGSQFFETATLHCDTSTRLPLKTLPNLRTLAFSVSTMIPYKEWPRWATWLAAHFSPNPPSLQTLRFTEIPLTEDFIEHLSDLDRVASGSNIYMDCVFDGSASRADELFEGAVNALRLALPLWNSTGKLEFWLGLELDEGGNSRNLARIH
ncbi:hypothetical protein DL96DRAFT_1721752 [Flagelloscypha sp. PMI_526]|nr:hypothetical protein DL96DRAFT_1721752 [Flagelloscypha sp. PMI_526]